MTERLLAGARVLVDGAWEPVDVRVRDGRVVQVGRDLDARDAEVVDVAGRRVVPGFVELQVNGGHGIDLTSDPGGLWELAARLPEQGVTAFLPTLVSCPSEVVDRARDVLAAGPPPGWRGAVPLGWHVEGPMLSPARRGAHDPTMLRSPASQRVDGWSRDEGIALVTLAPELPGAVEVVATLVEAGVVVAAGHTEATPDQVRRAVDAGLRLGTHVGNAMPAVSARAPGPVGALLVDPRVRVSCIADGVHLAPEVLDLVWRVAGPDRTVLVTDAMAATGLEDGVHRLGSQQVHVADGRARLADGTLAGSVATLDGCVRHLLDVTGADPADVLRTVTRTPADLLRDADRGRVADGARADLVVLDDDLQVRQALVGGELVHTDGGGA